MFNIPSPERQALLTEFQKLTGKKTVSTSIWVCLHVCDIAKLRKIAEDLRSGLPRSYLHLLEVSSVSLPLRWVQFILPYGESSDSDSDSLGSNSSVAPSDSSRTETPGRQEDESPVVPKRLAKDRDEYRYALTGDPF